MFTLKNKYEYDIDNLKQKPPESLIFECATNKTEAFMRILMLAEDCNPDWTSLPVVGYKFAKAIAEFAEVTLVTQIRNQKQLERDGCGNAKIIYIDTEEFAAPLDQFIQFIQRKTGGGWTFSTGIKYFHSLYYEWKVWQRFRSELEAGAFDIVHRITPMSPTHPSILGVLSPVPFVLGPLNGGLAWPHQFQSELRREGEWLSYLRHLYKVLPYVNLTYEKATVILAAFEHTIADLPQTVQPKMINFPEVGIDPALFSYVDRTPTQQKTILFVGRLVPYKMPEVVVRAFAASPILRSHRLVMIGDGPERDRLERIIADHHLESCVSLLGQVPQAEVGQWMRKAEIFAFPSIRELGAGVVIEAMACGMAPVVVDYGAPADLVRPGCGVKIPLGTSEALVDRFTIELEQLVNQPHQIKAYGEAAHHHAIAYYAWEAKARQVLKIYEQLTIDQCFQPDSLNLPLIAKC